MIGKRVQTFGYGPVGICAFFGVGLVRHYVMMPVVRSIPDFGKIGNRLVNAFPLYDTVIYPAM
jgi:hypothetical protein